MRKLSLLAILYASLFTAHAHGQAKPLWEPPRIGIPSLAETEQKNRKHDLVSKIALGPFNVVLEETRLEQVAAHFNAPIGQSGDAGDSLAWVCLHGQEPRGQWVLWIESGEIHGSAVGGFLLMQREANSQLDRRCKPVDVGRISLPIPLRLGMSRAQVVAALGPPTSQSASHLFYFHHRVVKPDQKTESTAEPFDLINTLYIRFNSRDEVDALQVWRTSASQSVALLNAIQTFCRPNNEFLFLPSPADNA